MTISSMIYDIFFLIPLIYLFIYNHLFSRDIKYFLIPYVW